MANNYYYFDPSQRDKAHVSRSNYSHNLFSEVIKIANTLGITKYIEGYFYDSELRYVLNNFSLAPSSRETGKIPKTHYCRFEINPSIANN